MTQRRSSSTYGFSSASSLLQSRVRRAGESRGFSVTRLLTHWDEIVGPDTAARARPVKITYRRQGFGATLVLLVQGAQAPLVQALLPEIREKVNACYGYNAIARITLTQTAQTGFAENQTPFSGPTPTPKPGAISPAAHKQASGVATSIQNPQLRAAITRLGGHVLSRTERKKA